MFVLKKFTRSMESDNSERNFIAFRAKNCSPWKKKSAMGIKRNLHILTSIVHCLFASSLAKKKLGKHCTYIQSERGVSQSAFIWNALSKYCRKMLAPKDQQRLARLSPYISALDFCHFLVELDNLDLVWNVE